MGITRVLALYRGLEVSESLIALSDCEGRTYVTPETTSFIPVNAAQPLPRGPAPGPVTPVPPPQRLSRYVSPSCSARLRQSLIKALKLEIPQPPPPPGLRRAGRGLRGGRSGERRAGARQKAPLRPGGGRGGEARSRGQGRGRGHAPAAGRGPGPGPPAGIA